MSLRFLLGILPSGLPDENNHTYEEINNNENAGIQNYTLITHFQTPAKFHIGMLTISLLVGIAYGGYTAYICWMEKNIFLGYIRNLVIALACRTFFSVVFDGAILLTSPCNVGGNALLSFEQIFLNLVLAFWLTLNIYLHERVQRNFNNEPTLMIYQLGVPGVTLFFVLIWIFTLQSQYPNIVWWISLNPFTQWIVNSINLLYLLAQLALLANIVRIIKKITLDNDAVSLLRKASAMMGIMVLIFWLHFGFSTGIPLKTSESYLYFFYLIDGLECALMCLVLYFFNKWVLVLLNKISSLILRIEGTTRTSEPNEILLAGGGRIKTIASVFMTRESGRWKNAEEEGSKDVVYSNVIEPERLKRTLELYKRLNIMPANQVTTVEGEEFYDCQLQNPLVSENSGNSKVSQKFGSSISNVSKSKILGEDKNLQSVKVSEQKQKKNAFYSSKYLILDSKENEIPKYLETRPSVSSVSGKDSLKDERIYKDFSSEINTVMADELVQMWLDDNSENMQNKERSKTVYERVSNERKPKSSKDKDFSPQTLRRQLESTKNVQRENENQTIFSAMNSVVSSVFFGLNKSEKKSLDRETARNIKEFCEQSDLKALKFDMTDSQETEKKNKNILGVTEEKSMMPTEINSEIKQTDFDVAVFGEKNKLDMKAEETEKPRNSDTINFKNKQIIKPQVNGNQPVDMRTNENFPNEYLDDLNLKEEHEELPALTHTANQYKPNQMKYYLHLNKNETLTPKDKLLQHFYRESYSKELRKEEPVNYNEDQADIKPLNTASIQNLTSNTHIEELSSLDSEVQGSTVAETIKKGKRTPGESLLDFKYESELSVPNNKDGLVELLKNDFSLSNEVSDHRPGPATAETDESEPEPEKPLNQYITYSDLLEFCSQRDKSATNQPTGQITKKLFDFSEALSSTIGSLISASSSFFTTKEHLSDSDTQTNTSDLAKGTKEAENNELIPNKSTHDSNTTMKFPSSRETVHVQPNKNIDISKTTEPQLLSSDYQKQILDITKNESLLKKKSQKSEARHKSKNKKSRNFDERLGRQLESHLPVYTKQNEKFQKEPFRNHETDIPVKEPEITETSDSEFSIERKKDSSSSAGSFCVDNYYLQVTKSNEKFYNQSNFVHERQKKGKKC